MGGTCSTGGGGVYTGFWWGNLNGKRPLGSPRRRWQSNIKVYFKEVGCNYMTRRPKSDEVTGEWRKLHN